jgi:hypothetical protein
MHKKHRHDDVSSLCMVNFKRQGNRNVYGGMMAWGSKNLPLAENHIGKVAGLFQSNYHRNSFL